MMTELEDIIESFGVSTITDINHREFHYEITLDDDLYLSTLMRDDILKMIEDYKKYRESDKNVDFLRGLRIGVRLAYIYAMLLARDED
jgi:hypothetical protein